MNNIGAAVTILDDTETRTMWRTIAQRYGRTGNYAVQFEDEVDDASTLHTDDGWARIGTFIAPLRDLYLFFEPADEKQAFHFDSGEALAHVLMGSGCRNFYITDAGFLVCYSDHDIVLAAGTAQPWLAKSAPAL